MSDTEFMSPDQIERNKQQARRAAQHDHESARDPRAAWWVAELSYKLGIVDGRGMIDVSGEVARDFERRYAREYSRCARQPGWGPGTVGG